MKTTLLTLFVALGAALPAVAMTAPVVEEVQTQSASPSDIHNATAQAIFDRFAEEDDS